MSLSSYAATDHHHGYDGDWANPDYWAGKECSGAPCEYDYTWDKRGERRTLSQEFRFSSNEAGLIFGGSTDWLAGFYFMDLDEDNDLYSEYNSWPDEVLTSRYSASNYAVFAQLDSDLGRATACLSVLVSSDVRVTTATAMVMPLAHRKTCGAAISPCPRRWLNIMKPMFG